MSAREPGARRPRPRRRPRQLELDVVHVGSTLRFTLASRSSGDAAPIRRCERRAFDAERVRGLQEEMTALLNRASRWGHLEAGSHQLLRAHGELLFDELLPDGVKQALRAAGPCELTLVVDASLVFVPWEWMHTGRHFIGLDYAVGRLVRSDQPARGEPRAPRESGALDLLVLCDPRGDLMGSYYEGVSLRDRLDAERGRVAVDLRSTEVTSGEIQRLIRDYDVIHYAGHAEVHPGRPADSGWLTHDGTLSAASVLGLAGGRPFPRLVFANACRSGQVDGQLVPADQGEAVYSLASAFLLAGVQHYVGTLWDVPDEPACHFSMAFYEAALAGWSYGRAMLNAREALQERYGHDSILWAGYLLYGDPSDSLLQTRRQAASSRPADLARAAASARSATRHRTPRSGARTTQPRVVRGGASEPRRFVAADPPFERAGAGSKRLLAALAVTTMVTLTALLTILASRAPRHADVRISPMATMPGATAPELFPAPRDYQRPAGTPSEAAVRFRDAAPAAVAPGAPGLTPTLEARVQRGDDPEGQRVAAGETLRSWDNFRLRFQLDQPAAVALWHVESQGDIHRIVPPEGDAREMAEVGQVGWTTLPGGDRWYYLDDRKGTEVFLLAVNRTPPTTAGDGDAWGASIETLARNLTRARRPAVAKGPELVFRGIGGTRAAPGAGQGDQAERLVERLVERFGERYEHVQVLELGHQ